MKVGYTGTFWSGINPATNDGLWECEILEIQGDMLKVEIEDGRVGMIPKSEFTPRYFRKANEK